MLACTQTASVATAPGAFAAVAQGVVVDADGIPSPDLYVNIQSYWANQCGGTLSGGVTGRTDGVGRFRVTVVSLNEARYCLRFRVASITDTLNILTSGEVADVMFRPLSSAQFESATIQLKLPR